MQSKPGAKMSSYELDLRGVACPMNFVKTRLFLDKIQAGDILKVTLDAGEPVESVSSSIQSEGHTIEETVEIEADVFCLTIRKT